MSRTIMHLDLDAFFCAVEELRDPSLRGKPFAVGGQPNTRGVVASCSYAARRYGVRSAMPMSRALRLCPELLVVRPRHGAYHEASQQVMERVHELSALVEQISIDEAFVDVSALSEPGQAIARRLQGRIRDELGLPCSLGVASNKLVAKIATDVGKASARGDGPPRAILAVPPGSEAAFLAPLPTRALWGVGPTTAERLASLGIQTVGDIARTPEAELARLFGRNGYALHRHAQGLDDSPVITHHEAKSMSREVTYARDVSDEATLRRTLDELADDVAGQLRAAGKGGATVKLKLRWPDFTTLTRQESLPEPVADAAEIRAAAQRLFDKTWERGKAVRLIGVGVSGLMAPVRQLGLWDRDWQREGRVQEAVRELQKRYGADVVRRGLSED